MVMMPSGLGDCASTGDTPRAESPAMAARRVIVLLMIVPSVRRRRQAVIAFAHNARAGFLQLFGALPQHVGRDGELAVLLADHAVDDDGVNVAGAGNLDD